MKSFTLKELGAQIGAQLIGDPDYCITGVNTLEEALSSDASFLANPRYSEAMKKSKAGVICVAPGLALPEGKYFFISPDPSRSFQQIAEILIEVSSSGFTGIHPTAVIHETAIIGPNVVIGPHAVIDRNSRIGAGTHIGANVSIGFEVDIGADCQLHPNCVVRERCKLGDRVILQPGAVIGSCG
ncbi:MAG: UDP-3-O-(3-hydroxymyristoyl)glucosamine N-acyltransferase, partial [Verrucomicrobiota bacterium]|nr:UDP-3-O-(3-hydroxymyristoyl)glucosamine N-acyltransferase [Verrucomicrobiota bacterium]